SIAESLVAPADSAPGTSTSVALEMVGTGHTSPGEGGGGGIPTVLDALFVSQASGGAISGVAALFQLFLNTQLTAQWSPDCANGETVVFVVEKTGGVLTARGGVRDPATGVLSAP